MTNFPVFKPSVEIRKNISHLILRKKRTT